LAKIVELIHTEKSIGIGVSGDPHRMVQQWFQKDGTLVFEVDTWQDAQQHTEEENLNSGKSAPALRGEQQLKFEIAALAELIYPGGVIESHKISIVDVHRRLLQLSNI